MFALIMGFGIDFIVNSELFLIGSAIVYIATEGISVYENLSELGVRLPFAKYFEKVVVDELGDNWMIVMDNTEFVRRAVDAAQNHKTLYVMCCFGAPMNSTNKARYTSNHPFNAQTSRKNKINEASYDTFGFDCVCFIKGLLWGWNDNVNWIYGGAVYKSNWVDDDTFYGMLAQCVGVSSNFSNIVPGEMVYMPGHVGIYIGEGLAVECTPIWKDGVQITAVGNIGNKIGYNTRTWQKHGKLRFINSIEKQLKRDIK